MFETFVLLWSLFFPPVCNFCGAVPPPPSVCNINCPPPVCNLKC